MKVSRPGPSRNAPRDTPSPAGEALLLEIGDRAFLHAERYQRDARWWLGEWARVENRKRAYDALKEGLRCPERREQVKQDYEDPQTPEIEDLRPLRDPYSRLTPTQQAVYAILNAHPFDGACRRDFSQHDVYEVSNRIGEIETRLGIVIERERCRIHTHRHPITRYRL